VMIDVFSPLGISEAGLGITDPSYVSSWSS
jgi:hypothetical protein